MDKDGCNQARIAESLGRDPGTVSREIRGSSGYPADKGLLRPSLRFLEKGGDENTSGLIRQYLPKGRSFKNLDMAKRKEIERKLNMRLCKRLGFAAPMEYRDKLIAP